MLQGTFPKGAALVAVLSVLALVFFLADHSFQAENVKSRSALNSAHFLDLHNGLELGASQTGRHLLSTGPSCACVCAGTHEGYARGVQAAASCTPSACVALFPSCQVGESLAYFSDGTKPTGVVTGVLTQQRVTPNNCEGALLGTQCAKQYRFSIGNGFIQLISSSNDACVPGSAQQSIAFKTRDTQAAGHFVGNLNNSAFILTSSGGDISMDINQGCIITYKLQSGGPLLSAGKGKCFPGSATVQTPAGRVKMSNLQLGDQVLTSTSLGRTQYETVFMFSHQDRDTESQFTRVRTASGHSLTLSPGHYLWASTQRPEGMQAPHTQGPVTFRLNRGALQQASYKQELSRQIHQETQVGEQRSMLRAADIRPLDYVWIAEVGTQQLQPTEVLQVDIVQDVGLYNPHTGSGTIIVDDVATMTFTDTLPASTWMHTIVTAPGALAFRLCPSIRAAQWIDDVLMNMAGVS